jgi:hypothetical protein
MNLLLIISILLLLAPVIAFCIVYFKIIPRGKANRLSLRRQYERLQPLFEKFDRGQLLTPFDIYEFAENKLTRELTFLLLQNHRMTELFPDEFYSIEKAAESNLANWLEFPTELDACPNEIEHIKKVPIYIDGQNHYVYYHVYKFRMDRPHWAAKAGWMLGVVGPYSDHSKPYDHPKSTFSRLHKSSDVSRPDEEAKWVHENILVRVMEAKGRN